MYKQIKNISENLSCEDVEKIFNENDQKIIFENWYDLIYNSYYSEYQVWHDDIWACLCVSKSFEEVYEYVLKG